jgi:hypothetical protein
MHSSIGLRWFGTAAARLQPVHSIGAVVAVSGGGAYSRGSAVNHCHQPQPCFCVACGGGVTGGPLEGVSVYIYHSSTTRGGDGCAVSVSVTLGVPLPNLSTENVF